MDDPTRTQPVTGRGLHKLLALAGALLFMGAVLYLSRSPLPSESAVAADDVKEKKPTPKAVAAAKAFLDSLDDKQKEKVQLKFDSARKSKWSNLPVTMVQRNGVALGDMTRQQREKAMDVLAAVLSKEGYQKVIDIMDG